MNRAWQVLVLLHVLLPWPSWGQTTTQGKVLPVQVRATPLFDGLIRNSGPGAVYLDAMNKGPDIQGTFVYAQEHMDGTRVMRERSMTLPKNSRKAWSFLYQSNWGPTQSVAFRGLSEPLDIVFKVRPVADTDVVLGVVGFDAQGVNVVSDAHQFRVPVANTSQRGDQTEARAVRVGLTARDMLPDRTEGYAALNWLIWPDIDPSSMSPEQTEAMRLWVANGGHLFVTVTDTSRQLMDSPLEDLMPATAGGIQEFSTIRGFTKALRQKRVRNLAMPAAVLQPKSVAGRNIHTLASLDDETAAWVVGSYGLGSVHMVSLNLRDPAFQQAVDVEAMWRTLLWLPSPDSRSANGPFKGYPEDVLSLLGLKHYVSSDIEKYVDAEQYGIIEYLSDIPGVAPLPLSWLFVFSVVYLLCIGPIDYFVLKRLGRQPWTWVTFPTYIVVFSAIAMIGASWSKGSQSVVKRLEVVDILPGASVLRGSNNVGLFVTGRTEVALQSAYSHSQFESNGGFMENVRRVQGMGGETLKWGTQTWTLAYGQSHWLQPESEWTLHVSMDAQGLLRVENQTGQVLESCRGVIQTDGTRRRWVIGWVQPEETKEVSATLFDTEPMNGMYYDSDQPEEWAIVAALDGFIPTNGAPLARSNQGMLACTLSQWSSPLEVRGVNGRKESITVLRTVFDQHPAFLESK